ncbi:hypothetical protein [Actinomadura sp. BRA 177]|uniref:hypothetical protein n=1 Tax=Actinomadura sp. BRA 177 TaxID=2745202 RepID=UPI001C3D918B|nr:hypothetical protein [Actinomadura sp. BRA 177]
MRRTAHDLDVSGEVPVIGALNVYGRDHVYTVGDITDVPEAKRGSCAMRHGKVVAENITAQLRGERPAVV